MADSVSTTSTDNSPEKPLYKRSFLDAVNVGYVAAGFTTLMNAWHDVKNQFYKNQWDLPEHEEARKTRDREMEATETSIEDKVGKDFSWKGLFERLKDTRAAEAKYHVAVDKTVFGVNAKRGIMSTVQKFGKLAPYQQTNVMVKFATVGLIAVGAMVTISHEKRLSLRLQRQEQRNTELRHEADSRQPSKSVTLSR